MQNRRLAIATTNPTFYLVLYSMDDTRTRILSEAEFLIRRRGYAAFSYADLADRVRIRKASIHHHFPMKEMLGSTLIDKYLLRFEKDLHRISMEERNVAARLSAYSKLFSNGLKGGMLPLCGALSAELSALPASLKKRVRKFFNIQLDWLYKNSNHLTVPLRFAGQMAAV